MYIFFNFFNTKQLVPTIYPIELCGSHIGFFWFINDLIKQLYYRLLSKLYIF